MKIILIGGHLSPLLSVLDTLPKTTAVLVIGRKYALEGETSLSLEYQTLKEKNIPFVALHTGRLQRRFTKHTIPSLVKVPVGIFQALQILRSYKPDVVVSFGGYISLPVIFASVLLGIPVVIHEQTMSAGMANKIASTFAKKICISWESSQKYFPKEKIVLTGNPTRNFQFSTFNFQLPEEKLPIIYITGGSLGAHAINELISGCIEQLVKKYIVIHQTGDAKEFDDYEKLLHLRDRFNEKEKNRYFITKFISPEEVGSILEKATLVIARSGINTVTELITFGVPSLLIPLPHGQKNEQIENARYIESLGLGKVLEQNKATSERVYQLITTMIDQKKEYEENGKKAKEIIKPDAAERIVAVIEDVIRQRN